MATSGTTAFNLDIADLIEEAWELVGKEVRTGYDMRTARRSLNILMREWHNRGINLWTIEESTVAVAAAATSVTLASDTIDVIDCNWRTGSGASQNDRIMTRISVKEWAHTANKNSTGEPTQFWVNRVTGTPVLYIWPVPIEAATLVYYKIRQIEDVGVYTNNMDFPTRLIPAMTAGLAYYLSMKTPGAESKIMMLKQHYEEQYRLAAEEDRERASMFLVPDVR